MKSTNITYYIISSGNAILRLKRSIEYFASLPLTLLFALTGCGNRRLSFAIGDADKLTVKSGFTGDEAEIVDDKLIRSITEEINALHFERTSGSHGKNGFAYMLTWYDADGSRIVRITITDRNGYRISHDGSFYKVGGDRSIDVDRLTKLLCK